MPLVGSNSAPGHLSPFALRHSSPGVEDWKRRIRERVGGFGGSPEKNEAAKEGEEYVRFSQLDSGRRRMNFFRVNIECIKKSSSLARFIIHEFSGCREVLTFRQFDRTVANSGSYST